MAAGYTRQTADSGAEAEQEEEKGLLQSTTQTTAKIELTDSNRERHAKYKLAEKEQVALRWSDIELDIKVANKPQSQTSKKSGSDNKNSSPAKNENENENKSNEKRIQILRGISGCANPGELYCIMGASGGGKTTLLSILTGRIRTVSSLSSNSTIAGQVYLNNMAVDCSKDAELNYLLKNIRFVMQHDVLYPTEKCREVITNSAKLRLKDRTAEERDELISFVMESLDLTKCGDTFIGSEEIRGLSGGERTRTSIGVEVATNPRILVLDEPTSGLDSASAYATMLLLKKLATLGRTVIACIHQPSAEILEVIDRLMVLAKGKVVYEGGLRGGELAEYLSRLGRPCPQFANVTDHFIASLNAQPVFFIDEWRKYQQTVESTPKLLQFENLSSVSAVEGGVSAVEMAPFCTQLRVLLVRLFWIFFRDSAASTSRLVKMVLQALVLGVIWWKLPYIQELSDEQEILTTVNNRMGGIFMALAFTSMNILSAACIEFPSERLIFEKERSARWYRSVTYLLAKLLLLLPWNALIVLAFTLISYWMVAFNMTFIDYFGGLFLIAIACDSFAVFVSTFAANARQGSQYMPILTNFLILFSGMFIAIESIPSWLRWLRWVNPFFYGLQFLSVAEFDGVESADGVDVGEMALERVGFEIQEKYFNLVVLTILWAGLRLCAFVSVMVKHGW